MRSCPMCIRRDGGRLDTGRRREDPDESVGRSLIFYASMWDPIRRGCDVTMFGRLPDALVCVNALLGGERGRDVKVGAEGLLNM